MQLAFSAEDEHFRTEAREWIRANKPREPSPLHTLELREYDLAWQRAQYDGG